MTLRRSNPLGTIALGGLTSIALVALDYGEVVYVAPAVGAVHAGQRAHRGRPARGARRSAWRRRIWLTTSVLQVINLGADGSALTAGALIYIGAWLLGDRVREGRRRRAETRERTVAEERAHIARELHDSAGHAINVILVQAGAARAAGRARPGRLAPGAADRGGRGPHHPRRDRPDRAARCAPTATAEAAPLPGLEGDPDAGGAPPRPRAPSERATPAGPGARWPARSTAPRTGSLQEALTNAARHGQGGAALEIDYGADELRLTVTNRIDLTKPPGRDGGGRGLVGMRERATLLGGGLDVAREADTFRVTARLPYDAPEEA